VGEASEGLPIEGSDLDAAEEAVLSEREHGPLGDRLLGQLAGTGRHDDEQGSPGERAAEVAEQLPGGGIGQVHVIEHHHDRCWSGQAHEQVGDGLEQPVPRRFPIGSGAAQHRHAAQEASEVVQQSPTEPGELRAGKAAQVALQRFRPQVERGRRPERIGAG
jgi:hypothetical protein